MAPEDNPSLIDLAHPENSQEVTVGSLADLASTVRSGVHYVLSRSDPIVTSDVATTPTFELVFYTLDDAGRDKARAALGNGQPLLLQTPPEQGVGDLYFCALSWSEGRPSRVALHSERRFSVQAVEVAPPA